MLGAEVERVLDALAMASGGRLRGVRGAVASDTDPSINVGGRPNAAAGMLNEKIGGVPVYPYQPDDVWESLAITKERDFTYPASTGADLYRRSLYTFWRRTVGPANMFDASTRQTCKVRQSSTSTPLHALTTLNDVAWVEAGRALAERPAPELVASASPPSG